MTRSVLALVAVTLATLSGAARADSLTLVSAPPGSSEGTLVAPPVITAIDGAALEAETPAVVTHTENWASPFPGASYVSSCPTCGSQLSMCWGDPSFLPGPRSITFVQRFELPTGFGAPSLALTTTNDDAAAVYLNGNYLGTVVSYAMPGAPGGWSQTLTTEAASSFLPGTNELRYELQNYNAPCPLSAAWVATVSYSTATIVSIDVKPGSYPNALNLGSSGLVPVAVLTSPTFDALSIDPESITIAEAKVALRGKGTPMASSEDVNGDGLLDLVVQVEMEALNPTDGDTTVELRGTTFAGQAVRGYDSVRVVP